MLGESWNIPKEEKDTMFEHIWNSDWLDVQWGDWRLNRVLDIMVG